MKQLTQISKWNVRTASAAGLAALILFSATPTNLNAQSSSKEYVRLGGRVVAIENQTLTITTTSIPATAALNQLYSVGFTATGGSSPYTWSVSGAPWLSFGGATLSGTPSTAGTFTITVAVTDSSKLLIASQQFTIKVGLVIAPAVLPGIVEGTAYPPAGTTATLSGSGGTAPYSFAISSGALPSGLVLSTTGSITGTPVASAVGTANFTVTMTDANNLSATQNYSIVVVNPLSITSHSLPTATAGYQYSAQLSTLLALSGGWPPYTWTASSLPSCVKLDPASGTISGNCPTATSYSFTVQVQDSLPLNPLQTQPVSLSLTVNPPLTITTAQTLPTGNSGSSYGPVTFSATGGLPPYAWSVANAPNLPAGLNLSQSGILSSTQLTASGNFTFTITATDSTQPNPLQGTQTFSITITGIPIITTTSLPGATTGTAYSQTLQESGGKPPYTWSIYSGFLPPGLSLSSAGLISGTPTSVQPGQTGYDFTVQLSDGNSETVRQPLSIVLTVPPQSLYLSLSTVPAFGGGSPVEVFTSPSQTINSWTVTGQAPGPYGIGSVSPAGNSTVTYYYPPAAVMADEVATVTGQNSSYTASIFVPLDEPIPVVTAGGTTLSSTQTTSLAADQPISFGISANLGDNWTSANDYVQLYFAESGGAQVCIVDYYPALRTIYLSNDSGTGWLSGTIGATGSIGNSQCSVGLNGTAVLNSYALSVTLPITFNSSQIGQSATLWAASPMGASVSANYPISIVTGNITLSPTTAALTETQTQQFTATVTNQTSNGVNWSLNPQIGTISTTGLYTAPATVPAQETVTVTATSQANSSLSAWATVTLSTGTPYDLNLPNMTITGGTNPFTATLNINAISGFTINGSASVTFTAGNQINLGPGFTVTTGNGSATATFTATINPNIH